MAQVPTSRGPVVPAEPTTLVAAGILIEARQVLLSLRKQGGHLAGSWEFPGGKVHSGEDPREALRRELAEELGLDVCVGEIVDVTFHRYEDKASPILIMFFEAARRPGSPAPRAIDVAAFEWAGLDALEDGRFPAADRNVLVKVRDRLRVGVPVDTAWPIMRDP
jgi:8-oxo-dGTP diphosphatase